MKIDIEKLELADVLIALVNAASTNTMTVEGKLPMLTHRLARELIDEAKELGTLRFDSVLGRTLQIDLSDDVIDVTGYDRANGHGSALKVLRELGEITVVADDQVRNADLHARGTMADRLADATSTGFRKHMVSGAGMVLPVTYSPEDVRSVLTGANLEYAKGAEPLMGQAVNIQLDSVTFNKPTTDGFGK